MDNFDDACAVTEEAIRNVLMKSVNYNIDLRVQGTLVVTVDGSDFFVVQLDDVFGLDEKKDRHKSSSVCDDLYIFEPAANNNKRKVPAAERDNFRCRQSLGGSSQVNHRNGACSGRRSADEYGKSFGSGTRNHSIENPIPHTRHDNHVYSEQSDIIRVRNTDYVSPNVNDDCVTIDSDGEETRDNVNKAAARDNINKTAARDNINTAAARDNVNKAAARDNVNKAAAKSQERNKVIGQVVDLCDTDLSRVDYNDDQPIRITLHTQANKNDRREESISPGPPLLISACCSRAAVSQESWPRNRPTTPPSKQLSSESESSCTISSTNHMYNVDYKNLPINESVSSSCGNRKRNSSIESDNSNSSGHSAKRLKVCASTQVSLNKECNVSEQSNVASDVASSSDLRSNSCNDVPHNMVDACVGTDADEFLNSTPPDRLVDDGSQTVNDLDTHSILLEPAVVESLVKNWRSSGPVPIKVEAPSVYIDVAESNLPLEQQITRDALLADMSGTDDRLSVEPFCCPYTDCSATFPMQCMLSTHNKVFHPDTSDELQSSTVTSDEEQNEKTDPPREEKEQEKEVKKEKKETPESSPEKKRYKKKAVVKTTQYKTRLSTSGKTCTFPGCNEKFFSREGLTLHVDTEHRNSC